jgi:hypothetical protein
VAGVLASTTASGGTQRRTGYPTFIMSRER